MSEAAVIHDTGDKEISIVVATRDTGENVMMVGNEIIGISDYTVQSSADGVRELCIKIKGRPVTIQAEAELVGRAALY